MYLAGCKLGSDAYAFQIRLIIQYINTIKQTNDKRMKQAVITGTTTNLTEVTN